MMRAAHKLTILFVEDDKSLRDTVAFLLEDEGFRVLQAGNGQEALLLLQDVKPDLIISDITMPGMNGFEFCAQVRAQADLVRIPFIFLSARSERGDVRRGMVLGADDYLTKPFEAEELLQAIEVRLARAAESQAAIDKASADLQRKVVQALTHEFRTPLSLVVGYTEMLESTGYEMAEDDFQVILQGLHAGSERLMRLVEDFLLLSRLKTGDVEREIRLSPRRTAQPDQVIQHIVDEFREKATARKVGIVLDLQTSDAVVAVGQQDLAEILRRLVDNAIKFAKIDGGQARITTRLEEKDWVFEIADGGVGIRQEALGWIFEAFRQVDRHIMEQQGSGVGLTIAQGLTEVYGGNVAVESEPGKGSVFTVRLPLAAP